MRSIAIFGGILGMGMAFAMGCGDLKPERPQSDAIGVGGSSSGQHGKPVLDLSKRSVLDDEEKKLVVARVGDTEITLGEYEARLNDQPAYVRVRYNSLDKKREFLDNLVRFELLAFEAKERGFDADVDVVFAMKQAMIKKLMADDVESLVSMTDVSDEDVASYFKENQRLFKKPEQVRVSQIVVANEEEANRIHAALVKSFEDSPRKKKQTFMEYVRQHSIDKATKNLNGDTGFFGRDGQLSEKRGALPGAVTEAAFALERINTLSPVVADNASFRVLMLSNRRPQVEKTLEEVKRQIRNKLFRMRKDEAREDYLEGLRKKIGVSIDPDVLAKVKDPGQGTRDGAGPSPQLKGVPGVKEVKRMRKHLDSTAVPAVSVVPEETEHESE